MYRRSWLLFSMMCLAVLAVTGFVSGASAALSTSFVSAMPGQSSANSQSAYSASDQLVTNFNCADIPTYHIDRQMNVRAQVILKKCARTTGSRNIGNSAPSASTSKDNSGTGSAINKISQPLLGGTDADVILPEGPYPLFVQSESAVVGHGNTIVVNYNDTRSAQNCYAGLSYSTDGGATWHEEQPMCTGHGTNYGDPFLAYDAARGHWIGGDLTTGCGGQSFGLWTSTDGIIWNAGACAYNTSQGDRESIYVDNNASSPHYGTMFLSFNDFTVVGPPISVVRSTDGGATWSSPLNLPLPGGASFVRQILDTGGVDGTFFIEAMDEGGGALNPRHNYIYRSTDGGVTWSNPISQGPSFPAPGVHINGYAAMVFPTAWQYMGAGQPAAGPDGVVHYAFSEHGAGSDPSDVYYIRSTDDGLTWSVPVKLNSDASPGNANWQPSVAATANGGVLVTWYDGRNGISPTCDPPGTPTPCYERWGIVSTDNGATWQSDQVISDAISGLPGSPGSQVEYNEGDYDYASADGDMGYVAWNDGRVVISGTAQADVFFDKVYLGPSIPTATVIATGTATGTATAAGATGTPTTGSTNTPSPDDTSTATSVPTTTSQPTATTCPIQFVDVPVGSTFYPYIHCLACLGIVDGYPDGTFRPNNNVTRGQLSKIIANAAGFADNQTTQRFWDVPVGSTFFKFIGRLVERGYISGYPCGGPPAGPCIPPDYLPYFRPNNNATRGQLAKIDANAAGFNDPPAHQMFQDVQVGSTNYTYTYRLASRRMMNGYTCGTPPAGACVPPANLPYFLPNNNATRGQTAKIVSNTFFPECNILEAVKR